MFPFDCSNIQKCNFKECSLSWVALLNVFLLGNNFNLTFLKLYMFENFNFKESEKEKNYKNVLFVL
jgi:hypothetical protein